MDMKKLLSIFCAATISCAVASAAERSEFDTVDIIEDSALLTDKAIVGPVDENLYADVMSQLNDFCTLLSASGDYASFNSVNGWLMMNRNYFSNAQLMRIKRYLEGIDEDQLNMLQFAEFKDPTLSLLLSVFLGAFGVDRFYIGQPIAGILKLFTAGGFLIWWFIDIFLIRSATRNANYREFFNYLDMIE